MIRTTDPKFDDRDAAICAARLKEWDAVPGPRVGDFIRMADGSLARFCHHWGDSIQTTEAGSYYFGGAGWVDFSGGLDPAIPLATIAATAETRDGEFWIFHHHEVRAGGRVEFSAPCRVFKQVAP